VKRIALVITRFIPGGATKVVKQIISGLNSSFEFSLICGTEDFSDIEFNEIKHFCTLILIPSLKRNISPIKDYAAYRELYKTLKDLKPEIVHTHTSKAGILGRIAAKKAKIDFIIHSPHGNIYFPESRISGVPKCSYFLKILQYMEKISGRNTNSLTVLSKHEKKINEDLNLFESEKIIIIQNGISCSKFSNNSNMDFSILPINIHSLKNSVVITFIGRLSPEKGVFLLLEAIEIILKNHSDVNLSIILVGDGPDKCELEKFAKKLMMHYEIRIFLPGYSKRIREYLALSNIFVLPSFYEGFGLALVEAMAAGLPVIASASGGIPEIIEDNKDGLLFPVGNATRLAEKILQLLNSQKLQETLANKAILKARKFDIDRMLEKYAELYNMQ